ncbi:MAG TPA: Rieske (2Fe-2S) protein [Ectothiorhodospiraceae bacterium]|nr:Rieske (2Fe-2S) protein [Ectothiorhodospiraceae bacterium]
MLVICTVAELQKSKTIGFSYKREGEEQSAFVVYDGGEVYAYENRCPHVGVELNWQPDQFLSLDGFSIQCSLHGAQFRLEDGFCHSSPCSGKSLQPLKVAICAENVIIRQTDKE